LADALPSAELLVIEGMGHDVPRMAWPQIVSAIERTAERG
jgi:pimeloyl-ACP methyl ester carboxylesterase